MAGEKADGIVIRQADFSESSRVITFFTREQGRVSVLAKGAKRLKGPFDAALDLLSTCGIVFLKKSSGALGILTQAHLISRFTPIPGELNSLYGGYYVADLLYQLTEDHDADARLFELTQQTLQDLSNPEVEPMTAVVQFEVGLLVCAGLFPDLTSCAVCGSPVATDAKFAHWVSQGGLICGLCRREEYSGRSVTGGVIAVLRMLTNPGSGLAARVRLTKDQTRECHQLTVSAITHVLGRKPGTLRYLNF